MGDRTFEEVVPHAFEVALHYTSALCDGAFGMVLAHDRALGHPVVPISMADLPALGAAAVQSVSHGSFTILASRARVATIGCIKEGHGHPAGTDDDGADLARIAVMDCALAGDGWFVATRAIWCASDFAPSPCGLDREHLIVAVDLGPRAGAEVFRVNLRDAVGGAIAAGVRAAVLRELVIRPAFGRGDDRLLVPST